MLSFPYYTFTLFNFRLAQGVTERMTCGSEDVIAANFTCMNVNMC